MFSNMSDPLTTEGKTGASVDGAAFSGTNVILANDTGTLTASGDATLTGADTGDSSIKTGATLDAGS
jgi:hypothetical protein